MVSAPSRGDGNYLSNQRERNAVINSLREGATGRFKPSAPMKEGRLYVDYRVIPLSW